MALNFSSCSVFPSSIIHGDDESCGSRCNRSQGGFSSSWETENPYWYGRWNGLGLPFFSDWDIGSVFGCGQGERELSGGDSTYDPIALLPDDPFEQNSDSQCNITAAAIAARLMNLGANSGQYEANGNDFVTCYYWDGALLCSTEAQPTQRCVSESNVSRNNVNRAFSRMSICEARDLVFESVLDVGKLPNSNNAELSHARGHDGLPHEAFIFALGYLGVKDLLTVERVCRSLHSAVQNDPLLWRCIHVDSPLSEKITDDALLQLTQRAQGNLHSLSLACCSRITDDGIRHVLENNPRLIKLSIPGCVRLSLEGIINNLKAMHSSGYLGIKYLKLGRLFSVSEEQFGELKLLLGIDQLQLAKTRKPRFYHVSGATLAYDDDECSIDIEMCPVCQKYKLVYDCPSESCQRNGPQHCRACDVCIARCVQCGRCINDSKYVETFCLEYLCSGCWKNPPVRHENTKDN